MATAAAMTTKPSQKLKKSKTTPTTAAPMAIFLGPDNSAS
jgi:hypothetical protein